MLNNFNLNIYIGKISPQTQELQIVLTSTNGGHNLFNTRNKNNEPHMMPSLGIKPGHFDGRFVPSRLHPAPQIIAILSGK